MAFSAKRHIIGMRVRLVRLRYSCFEVLIFGEKYNGVISISYANNNYFRLCAKDDIACFCDDQHSATESVATLHCYVGLFNRYTGLVEIHRSHYHSVFLPESILL